MGELVKWWRSIFIGDAPEIVHIQCIHGSFPTTQVKSAITRFVNKLLKSNKTSNYKFGKTGQPLSRTDKEDYRLADYSFMFLLYKSKIPSHVESLEKLYSEKYKTDKRNDNKDVQSLGMMKSFDGFYYLYIVI